MQKNRTNIDGLTLQRRPQNSDLAARSVARAPHKGVPDQYLIDPAKARHTPRGDSPALVRREKTQQEMLAEQGDSLALPSPNKDLSSINLDLDDKPDKKGKGKNKKKKDKGPKNKKWWQFWRQRNGDKLTRKQIIKRVAIILGIILLLVAGFFAYKFLLTSGKLFKGNAITALFSQGKELKTDANGRSNVVLFGTSEDDPNHDGADLTDSIMIASIDQKKKDVFLISVPRDLYVDYGRACLSGFRGKVNVLYSCARGAKDEDAGQAALRQKLGQVFGLDIQYSVHLNYTALREAVDAVGGITVTIDSDDPRGILDRNFDWKCPNNIPQSCFNVRYQNGPAKLDGLHALYLARARGDDPEGRTYGLAQSNFDREKYQRAILIALKDKAASIGTLANPVAVNNLLDALGNNVRTNFDAEEVKTLARLGQEIKNESIRPIVLNDPKKPLVITGMADAQSIVQPAKGLYDYSELQKYVKAYSTGNTAAIEGATISVLNASGKAGAAQGAADKLTKNELTVSLIGNAPRALDKAEITLYDLSKGKKPGTRSKLESLFGVTVTKGKPAGVTTASDFVIIVGTKTNQ